MRVFIVAAGAILLCASPSLAQSASSAASPAGSSMNATSGANPNASMNRNSPNPDASAANTNLRAEIRDMLSRSGYTDVRVMPSSFMVRAKDRSGDPVIMSISPDSFTAVTADNSSDTTGSVQNASSGPFVNVPNADRMSSSLIGLDLRGSNNQTIGKIADVALGPDRREQAIIVSINNGARYVAMSPSAVQITYDDGSRQWRATSRVGADQLNSAPEFNYKGAQRKG